MRHGLLLACSTRRRPLLRSCGSHRMRRPHVPHAGRSRRFLGTARLLLKIVGRTTLLDQSHWSCTRAWRPRAHLHRRGVDRACERAHCSWTAQHLRTAAAAPAGLALRLHSVVHWHGWWQGLRRSVVLRPTRGAPPLRLAPTLVRLSRVVAVVASGRFFSNVDRVETTFFCATVRSRIGLTTSHITKIHVTLIRPFTRFRSRRARRTRARARRPLALPAASRCRSPRCVHPADPHARHCVPASSWRTRAAPSTAPVGQNRGRA